MVPWGHLEEANLQVKIKAKIKGGFPLISAYELLLHRQPYLMPR